MEDRNDVLSDWRLLEDLFEERAAIKEFDGDMSTHEAEQQAAQEYGFANVTALKKHIQELKAGVAVLETSYWSDSKDE